MKLPHFTNTKKTSNTIDNWIRIEEKTFNIVRGDVQFSMGSHANIHIKLDIKNNPSYYSFFIKKYEQQSNQIGSVSSKFDLYHRKFVARGTLIKSMDVSFDDEMNLDFTCDILDDANIQERRDEIIDDLLNDKTLPKDNDIT